MATSNIRDVSATITSNVNRCSQTAHYWISYENYGTNTETGVVGVAFDAMLEYLSASPAHDTQTTVYAEWNFGNLLPGERRMIRSKVQVPGAISIGDTSASVVVVDPFVNDSDTLNNRSKWKTPILCSYDPNDKLVMPGVGAENYVLQAQKLDYIIRFQNTGNDTAFRVEIIDTLDLNLDVTTFKIDASSHPVQFSIEGIGIVRFYFENILLPDSNTNETESHGFVRYSIQPFDSLPERTEIINTAYIYFDLNPPITTNTTISTVVSTIPADTITVGFPIDDKSVTIIPNPFNESAIINLNEKAGRFTSLELYNISGKLLKFVSLRPDRYVILQKEGLQSGIYFFKLSGQNEGWVGKVMIQ